MEQIMKVRFLKAPMPYAIEKNEGHNNYIVKWKDSDTH